MLFGICENVLPCVVQTTSFGFALFFFIVPVMVHLYR
ncbi:hypothetical protein [Sicyoidochytrium minutum DNA virus]|nr:hypothetical protein [Sicyoidochytrium minutum DNA virus]